MIKESWLDKRINSYLYSPIRYDVIIVVLLLLIEYGIEILANNNKWPVIEVLNETNLLNFISLLINGAISLSGFMVAALTIFISVNASLKVRGIEDANNALDIIFSTKHYKSIIDVFKHSIIELICLFVLLYIVYGYSANIDNLILFKLAFISIIIIVLSMTRSLFILFGVLGLEHYKKEEDE